MGLGPAEASRADHPQRSTGIGPLDQIARKAFPKWSGVVDRVASWKGLEGSPCTAAADGKCRTDLWRRFLASLGDRTPLASVKAVQTYINQVSYIPDSGNWQTLDYWASPDEFLARGGDCEDYAIAKYFSLKLMGFPSRQMRIVVLNDTRLRIAHAVLEVRLGGETYVLDNRYDAPVSWRQVSHYQAIYSVNEANYWVHSGNQKGMTWEQPATAAGAPAD